MTAQPKKKDAAKNIHQRLHEACRAVTYVQKDKPSGLKYSIVSHDAVTAKVRPALHAAGVIYFLQQLEHIQDGNRTEVVLTVRFQNIDDPTDFIEVPSLGYGLDQQDKGPGKAISYAVKYALLKTLGLETGDDPDLDQTTEHVSETKTATKAPKPTPKIVEPSDDSPSWDEWEKGVLVDLDKVKTEEERAALRDANNDAYAMCSKEAPDVAKRVREALGAKQDELKAA